MTTTLTADPRPLGQAGRHVSPLGYGSVPIGRAGYPFDDAERLLNTLLDAGITLIDTAAALRFAAFADGVTCALVGSGGPERFGTNIESVNAGPLPTEVVARLEQRFDEAAKDWPGLT